VIRLVTFVDVDDNAADHRQMSVSARHEAVLVNGRRVLLLDTEAGTPRSAPPGRLKKLPTVIPGKRACLTSGL
jgi:hypothetical protein